MRKVKECISAAPVRNEPVQALDDREYQERLPERYFATAMKCAVVIAMIAAATVIIIFADLCKIVALAVFGVFFGLAYFASKG